MKHEKSSLRRIIVNRKKRSEFQRFVFRTELVVIISLAVILGAVGIFFNLRDDARRRDLNLKNTAEAVAHSRPVTDAVLLSNTDGLTESLDTLKSSLSEIDVISVIGNNGERLYHSNHDLIGTEFDGTRPDFDKYGNCYAVNENGPSGTQRRVYAAVGDGTSGYVMTIMLTSNIRAEWFRIISMFLSVIIVAVLGELFLSYYIAGRIRKRLLGYEPDTFSSMFRIRDNTLESLDEGIVAVDMSGRPQFINSAAACMLNTDRNDPVLPSGLLGKVMDTEEKELSVPVYSAPGSQILIDRIPVLENGKLQGAVGILHDRTAFTKLAEDLAGTRFLVDSMRANNHDFTNKLHVILGLLQMERYNDAIGYIENITLIQRETIQSITRKLEIPSVAALLIGKTARASEVNVKFVLQNDSVLHRDDITIPEDVLITIIGNLVDNALDAMDGWRKDDLDEGQNELYVGIHTAPGSLLITVDDTGPGMEAEVARRIFEKGFSTKGEGRGTGLFEVKRLTEAWGGEIVMDSQPGSGTSFTVSFNENSKGKCNV